MGIDVRTKKEYWVICEVQDCGRKAPWASTASNAYKKARKLGWKAHGKKWACQRCLTAARYGRKAL